MFNAVQIVGIIEEYNYVPNRNLSWLELKNRYKCLDLETNIQIKWCNKKEENTTTLLTFKFRRIELCTTTVNWNQCQKLWKSRTRYQKALNDVKLLPLSANEGLSIFAETNLKKRCHKSSLTICEGKANITPAKLVWPYYFKNFWVIEKSFWIFENWKI